MCVMIKFRQCKSVEESYAIRKACLKITDFKPTLHDKNVSSLLHLLTYIKNKIQKTGRILT